MNKTDSIAREILGWETVSKGSWYDGEKEFFVNKAYFKPEKYMEHALFIVKSLEKHGFQYKANGESEVFFNETVGVGNTLPEAIINGAYSLIENQSIR
jgi:hypothetical protein